MNRREREWVRDRDKEIQRISFHPELVRIEPLTNGTYNAVQVHSTKIDTHKIAAF